MEAGLLYSPRVDRDLSVPLLPPFCRMSSVSFDFAVDVWMSPVGGGCVVPGPVALCRPVLVRGLLPLLAAPGCCSPPPGPPTAGEVQAVPLTGRDPPARPLPWEDRMLCMVHSGTLPTPSVFGPSEHSHPRHLTTASALRLPSVNPQVWRSG